MVGRHERNCGVLSKGIDFRVTLKRIRTSPLWGAKRMDIVAFISECSAIIFGVPPGRQALFHGPWRAQR